MAVQKAAVAPAPGAVPTQSGGSSPVAVPTPSIPQPPAAPAPTPAAPAANAVASAGKTIKVETDLYFAEISTTGGDLVSLSMKKQGGTLDPKKNFVLFTRAADHVYVAQSGLIGAGLPNHQTLYTAQADEYKLADGASVLEIRLEAAGTFKSAKIYRFQRDNYVIDVAHELTNTSAAPLEFFAYFQLVRDTKPPDGDSAMVPTYTGPAVYTDKEKFQKVAFGDIDKGKQPYPKNSNDGWVGMLQHYFLGAWLPKGDTPREFYTRQLQQGLYAAGVILPAGTVAPGASAAISVPLYAGPQEQQKLAALAPGLELAVDYGWLTVIAVPLFWVLQWIHGWAGNWGVAIIILTILIKLLFYPLSEASYRSMAKMRVVAPKLQRLKEQFGDDRQRMQQAMMELYKTEKINPLGGCLPIVVQIPVFIALYWVLLSSVEMRDAPWIGWIQDLAAPDTLFGTIPGLDMPVGLLPILMAVTMFIQTKLNPTPPDPVQAKLMMFMPLIFSVMFFFFPSGLVLYWLVNNIYSIIQQWLITRSIEGAKKAG
jgi:YidC/Oxa1 family membrane protein insertase